MTNDCYTLLFQQSVDFNRSNQGNGAMPTVNSLLFLNFTNIRMQLPKLPTNKG
jgi:hypothetical protein